MEDIGAARLIEHVRPMEKARERLAVLAIADETKAAIRSNFVRNPAQAAAPAGKRDRLWLPSHGV
jgi:hypothetical protein